MFYTLMLAIQFGLSAGDTWLCQNQSQPNGGMLLIKEPAENILVRQANIPMVKVIPRRSVRLQCICNNPPRSKIVTIGPSSTRFDHPSTEHMWCVGPNGKVCSVRLRWSIRLEDLNFDGEIPMRSYNTERRIKRASSLKSGARFKIQTNGMMDDWFQCDDYHNPYGNVNVVDDTTIIRCDANYDTYEGPGELYQIPLIIKCPDLNGIDDLEIGDMLNVRAEWTEVGTNGVEAIKHKYMYGYLVY